MRFLNYIDRKFAIVDQRRWIICVLFFGYPVGCFIPQLVRFFIDMENFHLYIGPLIFVFLFDVVMLSPFIINYFRAVRKYNRIIKKIQNKSIKVYKVKAKFDYKNFVKGQSYEFFDKDFGQSMDFFKHLSLQVHDNRGFGYNLKSIINKFELDDIKEERLMKLKKLKFK